MSVVSFDASARQIYRAGGRVNVAPVSKGTWTVTAYADGSNHRWTHRWTGLVSVSEIENAVSEAWRWLVGEVV